MDLQQIIRDAGMSTRPEYYSGRGATLSDLNTEILYKIHKGIKEHFGDEAAMNFVRTVNRIKKLSATTFLNELYMLEINDWKFYAEKSDESGIAVAKNEDGEYDMVSGMMGMFAAMGDNRDDTPSIKGGFCNLLPEDERPVQEECYYFSDGRVSWR